MVWYYEDNGKRVGPIVHQAMVALANSGALRANTLVWREGMSEWVPADSTELGAVLRTSAPPQLPGVPGMPRKARLLRRGTAGILKGESYESQAMIGMVLSLIGLLFCVLGLGGILFSTIALSGMSRTGNRAGHGMAIAGLILGIVDLVAGAIVMMALSGR